MSADGSNHRPKRPPNAEELRIGDFGHDAGWRRWGPYLSDRQWGTVREDYSPGGTAWEYLPHDHARSRAYRWGEDGLGGISDIQQRLCFGLALWNGADPILKERLFGLTGNEGNHGEDVKEYYFYLDNLPSHAYMRMLYKYPQTAFPYAKLVAENRRRTKFDPEYELLDTGVFAGDRYFDVTIEYAKATQDDILIAITATNRGPDPAPLHVLPTLWYRNTWSWTASAARPELRAVTADAAVGVIAAHDEVMGERRFYCERPDSMLFTENETNFERLFGTRNPQPYVKDAFHSYVIGGQLDTVNPAQVGTKAAARYILSLASGETRTVRLRLADVIAGGEPFDVSFDTVFAARREEADRFYADLTPLGVDADQRNVQRQAFAGLLWSKQYYQYVVREWLDGDPAMPPPPAQRFSGRNRSWEHLYAADIISMPDTWEYPWFAAWDLGFHVVALALIDPEFAKHQLVLLTREWYMHPNGQLPAYEWAFDDVNPPVHAWAAMRVFQIEHRTTGRADYQFLERVFQKLLLNFTWWVNRKDAAGNSVFQGGFLGLDNIGVFDRSAPLPNGGRIDQADGTSWMAAYSLSMLTIALELAQRNNVYEDIASKFFEHFLYIAAAMNDRTANAVGLWNEEDAFYYDVLQLGDGRRIPLRVHSMVGLIPLFAHEILEPRMLQRLPGFAKRLNWFIEHRPDLKANVACMETVGVGERRLLAIVGRSQLERILNILFDETRFLSDHGLRSLSRAHADAPFVLQLDDHEYRVDYEPAESTTGLFGGNSNWRGPIWFPLNFLVIESLQKYHFYYGDSFTVEFPLGSGRQLTLWEVAGELSDRLIGLFTRGPDGRRPVAGGIEELQHDPHWRDCVLFHEYFHGDNGAGLGASHQTGWTGLVAKLIQQRAEYRSWAPSHQMSATTPVPAGSTAPAPAGTPADPQASTG